MKIRENVTLFICDFCKKRLIKKAAMQRHEKFCSLNPENHAACSLCSHCILKKEYFLYNEGSEDQIETPSNTFFCEAKQIGQYPIKAVKKGLLVKYPETFKNQELMPKECDLFKGTWENG